MTDAETAAEEYAQEYKGRIINSLSGIRGIGFPTMAWDLIDFKLCFLAGIAWARANPESKRPEILKTTEDEQT